MNKEIYVSSIMSNSNPESGLMYYKINSNYRGYASFNRHSGTSLKHHQKLPIEIRKANCNDFTDTAYNTLEFLDRMSMPTLSDEY